MKGRRDKKKATGERRREKRRGIDRYHYRESQKKKRRRRKKREDGFPVEFTRGGFSLEAREEEGILRGFDSKQESRIISRMGRTREPTTAPGAMEIVTRDFDRCFL